MSLSRKGLCALLGLLAACASSAPAVDGGAARSDVMLRGVAGRGVGGGDAPTRDVASEGDVVAVDRAMPVDVPPPRAWVRALDASFLVTPNAVVASPDGRVCVVGDFQGDLRAQGRSVTSSGASDGFVACFDADGALLGLFATRAPGDDAFTAAAWAGDGLVVAGHLPGAATLGGVALSTAGGVDVVVARLEVDGRVTRAITLGGAGTDQPTSLAVDGAGRLHLAGASDQSLRAGTVSVANAGRNHAWVVTLDDALTPLRGRSFASAFEVQATALRVQRDGGLTLGGHFSGSLQTGAAALGPTLAQDIFVLRLDADGSTRWAQRYGGSADDRLHDLAVDDGGEVTVAGSSSIGEVRVGAEAFAVQGGSDGWLARLDAQGAPRWLRRVGGAGDDRALSIVVDASGGEVVGRFDLTLALGSTPYTARGAADGWRARFGADGALQALHQYGGAGPDVAARVTAAPGGSVTVGTFAAQAEVAGENLRTVGIAGAFVHRAVAVTP
ncbi:MAG: hypothetical protein U0325_02965 [Polyangiales bacterium]